MILHELKYDNFLRELHKDTFLFGKFILGCYHVLKICIEGWSLARDGIKNLFTFTIVPKFQDTCTIISQR